MIFAATNFEPDDIFEWLKVNVSPWDLVVANWSSTSEKRKQLFLDSEFQIYEYFSLFPCLRVQDARTLVKNNLF